MSLARYKNKRSFTQTPEPEGLEPAQPAQALRFVVQLHEASRTHYDLRLELCGVMKSFAVPKGPSLNPLEKRLAVEVEDHPISYNDFEGTIPYGNYGAGRVIIWDEGTYSPRAKPPHGTSEEAFLLSQYQKGHITFVLAGQKLKGEFALVRLKKGDGLSWLLLKKHDRYATASDITQEDQSVRSGRRVTDLEKPSLTQKIQAKSPAAPARAKSSKYRLPATRPFGLWTKGRQMSSPDGIYQAYWEGYRCKLFLLEQAHVLISKSGQDLSHRFSTQIPSTGDKPQCFDGMLVPIDEDGKAKPIGALERPTMSYHYYVYDILIHDGINIEDQSLPERLKRLDSLKAIIAGDTLKIIFPINVQPDQMILARSQEGRKGIILSPHYRSTSSPSSSHLSHNLTDTQGSLYEVIAVTGGQKQKRLTPISHPDKIYWPEDHITKGQLIAYYKDIAPVLLPHVKDRPQSLHRQPHGVHSPGFFQKEISGVVPGWMQTVTLRSGRSDKQITFALCQSIEDLIFLINLGCIELNTWLSRITAINAPDYLVFDLDPGPLAPFEHLIEVALALKDYCDHLKLPLFCKTSGSKGLHLYMPVKDFPSYDDARAVALFISQKLHQRLPRITSLERKPSRRQHAIYLDYLQNRVGQTMACVYAARPKRFASVSTPLVWSEVVPTLDLSAFNIQTVPKRVSQQGDLWHSILSQAIALSELKNKIGFPSSEL